MPVTWASVMGSPLPGSESRLAMLPTTVTSRPSRIHTVPRPTTTIQCQFGPGQPVQPRRDLGGDHRGVPCPGWRTAGGHETPGRLLDTLSDRRTPLFIC